VIRRGGVKGEISYCRQKDKRINIKIINIFRNRESCKYKDRVAKYNDGRLRSIQDRGRFEKNDYEIRRT